MVTTRQQKIEAKVENARTRIGKARVRAESLQPQLPSPPPPIRRIAKKQTTRKVVDHVLIPGPQDSTASHRIKASGLVEQEELASRAPQKDVMGASSAPPVRPDDVPSLSSPRRSSLAPAASTPTTPTHEFLSPPPPHNPSPSSSLHDVYPDDEDLLARVPLPPYESLFTEDTISKLQNLMDEAWSINPEATNDVLNFFWTLSFPLDPEERDGGLYSVDAESPEERKKTWNEDRATIGWALRDSLKLVIKQQEYKDLVYSTKYNKLWAYYRGAGPDGYVVPSQVKSYLDSRERLRYEFNNASGWEPRASSPVQSSPAPRNFGGGSLAGIEQADFEKGNEKELPAIAEDDVEQEQREEEQPDRPHRIDNDDEEEEEGGCGHGDAADYVEEHESKGKYKFGPANVTTGGRKGKSKSGSISVPSGEANPSSGAVENIGNKQVVVGRRRPGCFSKPELDEAFGIFKKFQDDIEAFSIRTGKSPQATYTAVGMNVVEDRELNFWNLFQMWIRAESGGGWQRGDDESVDEFEAKVKRAYERFKKKDTFAEEAADMRAWYYEEIKEDDITGGERTLTTCELKRLTTRFTHRAAAINRTHGVVAFGYIVDPKMAKVVAFGAGKAYERMKIENASKIDAQILDYSTMIHCKWMKDQERSVLPHEVFLISRLDWKNQTKAHSGFGDVMMMSLRKANPSTSTTTMAYGTGFADLCFKNRVRLLNWDPSTPALGTEEVWQLSKIKWKVLQKYMRGWVLHYREMDKDLRAKQKEKGRALFEGDSDDEEDADKDKDGALEDAPAEEDLLRFEPWTADEINLSYREQAEIPIVLSIPTSKYPDGKTLVRLNESPQFQQQRKNLKHLETDSEEDIPKTTTTTKTAPTEKRLHRRAMTGKTISKSDSEDVMEEEEDLQKQKKLASRKGKEKKVVVRDRAEGARESEESASETDMIPPPRPKPKPLRKKASHSRAEDDEPPRKRCRIENEGTDGSTSKPQFKKRKRSETNDEIGEDNRHRTRSKNGKKQDLAQEEVGRKVVGLPKRKKVVPTK